MKKFFVLRGVPGSGKRHPAEFLAGATGVIHSPEDFFREEDERRISKRNRAFLENKCLKAITESIENGIEIVVYCHTNIIHFRFEKHVQVAKANGYSVIYMITEHPDPVIAAAQSFRIVTPQEVEFMINQFKP